MTNQVMAFQEYILEAQSIYLEDIREGNPQALYPEKENAPLRIDASDVHPEGQNPIL